MKDYYKNKESLYLNYWGVNNSYGWAISQKLPLGSFKWVEKAFQFNKDFTESYKKDSDLNLMLITFTMIYPFYLKE